MTTCPYLLACRNWNCQYQAAFHTCPHYQQAEDRQVEIAARRARENGYSSEDVEFLAQFFRVPIGKLERKLKEEE